jgi:hypothetical protein
MKIKIDTNNKTIQIEDEVSLDDLISGLQKLFPEHLWKEYKLIHDKIIEFPSPIVVYREKKCATRPMYQPAIDFMSNSVSTNAEKTIFYVEI